MGATQGGAGQELLLLKDRVRRQGIVIAVLSFIWLRYGEERKVKERKVKEGKGGYRVTLSYHCVV